MNDRTEREKILDELLSVIFEAMDKAKSQRYRGKSHKTRNDYYKSVATLVNAYARLSRDLEIDELAEEIEKFKEELDG